ncbi:MAG: Rho termination factor N-terminal domain-containing protein [Actinomycetota bacterium]
MTTTREQFKEHANEATERLQRVLRDGAYATVGAGDTLFRSARTFAGRLATLREEAPDRAKRLAEDYRTRAEEVSTKTREYAESRRPEVDLTGLRSNVESEFDQLAARGREVVTTLQGSKATRRAAEQTKAATGQVKAAAEGVVSAAGSTAEEARSAVEGLRKTAEQRAKREAEEARETVEETVGEARESVEEAGESVKEAGASVKEAGEATVDALADAREKLAEGAGLEDLSVPELRKLAQERDVPGRTGMNKAELIKALSEQ